jgi:hypothetical protein
LPPTQEAPRLDLIPACNKSALLEALGTRHEGMVASNLKGRLPDDFEKLVRTDQTEQARGRFEQPYQSDHRR